MREINGHWVWGRDIVVEASNEKEARALVRERTALHIWEIKELEPNRWNAYVSDDAWATND